MPEEGTRSIGTAKIEIGGLKIKVVILEVKEEQGKTMYLVSPYAGTGEIWVDTIIEHF